MGAAGRRRLLKRRCWRRRDFAIALCCCCCCGVAPGSALRGGALRLPHKHHHGQTSAPRRDLASGGEGPRRQQPQRPADLARFAAAATSFDTGFTARKAQQDGFDPSYLADGIRQMDAGKPWWEWFPRNTIQYNSLHQQFTFSTACPQDPNLCDTTACKATPSPKSPSRQMQPRLCMCARMLKIVEAFTPTSGVLAGICEHWLHKGLIDATCMNGCDKIAQRMYAVQLVTFPGGIEHALTPAGSPLLESYPVPLNQMWCCTKTMEQIITKAEAQTGFYKQMQSDYEAGQGVSFGPVLLQVGSSTTTRPRWDLVAWVPPGWVRRPTRAVLYSSDDLSQQLPPGAELLSA